MFLDSTAKSITVAVDAAPTTAESDVTAHYVDYGATDTTPGSADRQTGGTAAVAAVSAPLAGTVRHVQMMTIYNADSVSHAYTVALGNGAASRKIVTMRLQAGQTVQYTKADGWRFVPEANPQHQEVSRTVTGASQWTAAMLVQAGDAVSVSIGGAGWDAAVSIQRMLDGATWNAIHMPDNSTGATAPVELTYIADETGYVRVGVAAGMFVSGSIPVRLGVH